MTRKEIEKRCLEEMQQNIPDREALWQRIEEQLPPQEAPKQQTAPIQMTRMRRVLAGAACFLLVAAGIQVFTRMQPVQTENSPEITDSVPEWNEQEGEEYAEETTPVQTEAAQPEDWDGVDETIRSYASLNLPEKSHEAAVLDNSMLGTDGELFHEASVLERTECFVDVIVTNGSQHPDRGFMTYTLDVVDAYGETELQAGDTIFVQTMSPYILHPGREYVLPIRRAQGAWELSYECAPQLELTLDGEVVYHNGWLSLASEASEPLLYGQNGTDDFFYDRMYITEQWVLLDFLKEWEDSGNL